jgi:hypothetical protein
LELRDGAVLTVNGTVNATGHGDHGKGWVEGSIRAHYDGAAVIAGTGVINLKDKGRLLNSGGDKSRRLTRDGVTLAGFPDNDSSLVGVNENGELILKSGAITGNTRVGNDWAGGGGVEVYRGTFTMEGGEISGNGAQGTRGAGGGGVNIGEEAVFTMRGGEISGNSASGGTRGEGGGVRIDKESVFTMSGGTISSNSASGDRDGHGGGVYIDKESVFTMSGGTISGNSASGGNGNGNGGGVRLGDSLFAMQGGTILGNTATSKGGGVFLGGSNGSTFTMQGGTISGNSVTGKNGGGGGVFSDAGRDGPSVFIMEGGTVYGKADSLPVGTDASLANSAPRGASLAVPMTVHATAKWGMGGTYTKGGVSQSGGSDIGDTDDTLVAIPAP